MRNRTIPRMTRANWIKYMVKIRRNRGRVIKFRWRRKQAGRYEYLDRNVALFGFYGGELRAVLQNRNYTNWILRSALLRVKGRS